MTETQLIEKMIAEFRAKKPLYNLMSLYYDGEHDVKRKYKKLKKRSNQIVMENFVSKFINEEIGYSLGNPISFVSKSGNNDMVDAIEKSTFHWKDNHNQELMRNLEIYGSAFTLNYIDKKGRFSERILNPENAICYVDADGVPVLFIHFYIPKYEDTEYHDIYYPDGRIEVYKQDTLIETKHHPFSGIPISICKLDNINDTIWAKIKDLQDAYNNVLSDQVNTISDFRTAILVIAGTPIDEEMEKQLEKNTVINLPSSSSSSAKWLIKEINDSYIEHNLERLRNAMYEVTNHVDGNEKLQSNTSGTALRNRLVFLEQRCNFMLTLVLNTIYERVERLFEYLALQGTVYDWRDVKITATPCIPQDVISIINGLVQLGIGTNISLETALSQIPFVENPAQEIQKIAQERKTNQKIELDKINDYGDTE